MESDGFQLVKYKKKQRLKTAAKQKCTKHEETYDEANIDATKEKIRSMRSEIEQSEFYSKLLRETKDASKEFPSSCPKCLGKLTMQMQQVARSEEEKDQEAVKLEEKMIKVVVGPDMDKVKEKLRPGKDRDKTLSEETRAGSCEECGKTARDDLQGFLEVLCYGLGRFSCCPIACHQLALLLALRNDLKIHPEKTFVYDPLFSSQEVEILKDFQMQVLPENEEGRRRCGSRCLVFMPHCGKALFNNLLWANWGSGLAHLVILGNSFSSFLERIPGRILKETGNFIVSIEPYMREVGVDNTFHHTDIFNDMSLHWFPLPSLARAEPDFWNRGKPPEYEEGDTEIITKKGTNSEDGHLSPQLDCR